MTKKITMVLLLAVILVSCRSGGPTPTPASPTNTVTPILPTNTPFQPSTATEQPKSTNTPTVTPTQPPTIYGPDNFPTDVNPLTGLKVDNPTLLDRRPVAVKINIVPRSSNRPPWGLSFADLVYEYYHNDGYARYHAIFYSRDAELVGPIRSGRLPDDFLIRMYKSIFAYGGADAKIENRFFSAGYANRLLREGARSLCPPTVTNPFCRHDPGGYDFLLASTATLSQYYAGKGFDNNRPNLNGMYFASLPPAGGEPGVRLYNRYSGDQYNRWDYDVSSGNYLLFQDNVFDQGQGEDYAPLVERLNDQQISAQNVIILVARHEYFVPPPAEIVDILLSGSGDAYAFRDGRIYKVIWNRPTTDSVLYLTFPDGSLYPFKPGVTWFHITGFSAKITQEDDGAWRFQFAFP